MDVPPALTQLTRILTDLDNVHHVGPMQTQLEQTAPTLYIVVSILRFLRNIIPQLNIEYHALQLFQNKM